MPVTSPRFDERKRRLSGVVAIPVTPFDADGAVDSETYGRLVDRVISAGIDVVTPNGNTGEFYALDGAETRHCLEVTVKATTGRASVVAGVGHDVRTAIGSARHARDAGADLVMIHQPVHPYVSAEGWVEYHRAIAAAVPELGVVLYVRDARIEGEQLARLADVAENVIGVKYAVPDPVRFASVARDAGIDRFAWIAGLAELSAPGYFAVGATGFTSGLVNVAPSLSLEMFRALRDGDFAGAMTIWERIRPFEELRAADGNANNVSVVKEALAQLGLCRADVRPPSRALTGAEREQVRAALTFF
ncbi:dihydrodipicolinate synthase family protein [Amycolatopsis keratiniphila]|uniref:Dihydrodipicolinate synthase family protein n=1 Tax=Amycolatopsis keratiniphila subsp. keratiniphila TaxID=227715 RepID=A0A1W2M3V9_9PSEU|nr:dihydrodipicolinate synthase family protein [Amycolatopsis keratiniphila]ONF74840.1 dihydrodipicolinate synthase family protein [Amycolatopsis keratiniphila subsp. keratiniphila]